MTAGGKRLGERKGRLKSFVLSIGIEMEGIRGHINGYHIDTVAGNRSDSGITCRS